MPELKPFLVPVLIAVEAIDADHATDLATRDLPDGFLGGDSERGAYEVPFAGSGRPITYEQLGDPDFSVFVAYGLEYLSDLDKPQRDVYGVHPCPPDHKEPPTDET